MQWGDLDARARGLATRLRSRSELESLAALPDAASLARALFPRVPAGEPVPVEPAEVDRALRRERAARLALLARWAGPRARALAVFFEDEDRRSVRALARGAARGALPAARLEALVPTPTLPEPVLERLAAAESMEAVVRGLAASGHPWGDGLVAAMEEGPLDPGTLETEVGRLFFRRALGAARPGGRRLRDYVRYLIDLENGWSALLWDAPGGEAAAWIEGGRALARAAFDASLAAGDTEARRAVLARALAGTPLGCALADPAVAVSALEAAELAARIERERRVARVEPLGPAPLLIYALSLRAEATALRRIAWGLALGAPAAIRAAPAGAAR